MTWGNKNAPQFGVVYCQLVKSPCLLIQHPVQFYLLFLGFVIQKVANIFHWTKTSAMKTNELSAK